MGTLTLFRASDLAHNERKWLKGMADARLGMSLDVDLEFSTVVSMALQKNIIIALGGRARAILMNTAPESDISARGRIEDFAGHIVITTWDLPEVMKDARCAKDFILDVFKARVYLYGLGNRSTGYVESIRMSGQDGEESFSVESFESLVSVYEQCLGTV